MGIRESLKEQPDDEDLKLQDFVIEEEPEQDELEFDVEKEITEQDWQLANAFLESFRAKKYWSEYLEFASAIYMLSAERLPQLSSDEIEAIKNLIKEKIKDFCKKKSINRNARDVLPDITNFKIIFPDEFSQLGITIEQEESIKREIEGEASTSYIKVNSYYTDIYYCFKIAFPTNYKKLRFDQKKIFLRYKSSLFKRIENNRWEVFSASIGALRIFSPDHFQEEQITKKQLEKMKKQLKAAHDEKGATKDFFYIALSLKILTAREVRVTDQGVELIMPEKQSHQQKIPPRPERRQS